MILNLTSKFTQPVLTDVKAENKSENLTADKFKDKDTLTLKASYDEKKLGTANILFLISGIN